ncbi:MAG: hypothetical protein PHS32_01410 [Rhodoferax sp.]|uniref:hypothetical protein n=1 Tax=Rhodoferax sp. TaxID=50421 RepID=UPI0026365168|nr:hypothetical protein [Rhodoferax sp.]MDD5332375.1 hypothetical protein [Rhodoferax sp.]
MITTTSNQAASRQIRSQIAQRGNGIELPVGLKPVGCPAYASAHELAEDNTCGCGESLSLKAGAGEAGAA